MRFQRGFNEAGADCPGIHLGEKQLRSIKNFASMRPGQTAPEFLLDALRAIVEDTGLQ